MIRRPMPSLCLSFGLVLGCLAPLGATPTANASAPRAAAPTWNEVTGAGVSVGGTYIPIVGKFDTPTGSDDIIWYAPGSGTDQLWRNRSNGAFTKAPLSLQVNGTYTPIVGNFGGNELEDILWYGPGTSPDSLWITTGPNAFTPKSLRINGTYTPVVLDDVQGYDELIWQSGTGTGSSLWTFDVNGLKAAGPLTTPPGTRALVGRFVGGSTFADVFWYGPGVIADALWDFNGTGAHADSPASVKPSYTPVVGDFSPTSAAHDDIFWYRSGLASSRLWLSKGDGTWTESSHVINAAGMPLSVKREWSLVHIWTRGIQDYVWEPLFAGGSHYRAANNTNIPAGYTPIMGTGNREITNGGGGFILWYKAGTAPEYYFS